MNEFYRKNTWGPIPSYPLVERYMRNGNDLITVAGPCSVESKNQVSQVAKELGRLKIKFMRGGIFRAGTYPGEDFGLIGEELIEYFHDTAHDNGMDIVLEVLDYSEPNFSIYKKYADIFQIGARQMQNYTLLSKLGECGKPVFLKRNMGSTLNEFLGSAEHLLKNGVYDLTLIERGSSTFLNHVRWDLSISLIAAVKHMTEIPIIVDASHGTGRWDLVRPMTLAGIAAGADGYLIETHPDPENSLSDKDQAISIEYFSDIHREVVDLKELTLNY